MQNVINVSRIVMVTGLYSIAQGVLVMNVGLTGEQAR